MTVFAVRMSRRLSVRENRARQSSGWCTLFARLGGRLNGAATDATSRLEVRGIAIHSSLDVADAWLLGVFAILAMLVAVLLEVIVTSMGLFMEKTFAFVARALFDFSIASQLAFEGCRGLDANFCGYQTIIRLYKKGHTVTFLRLVAVH